MIQLYGIANCDSVKKARRWFADHDIDIEFHDFKKEGIKQTLLSQWCDQVGWEILVNRRGTTWRQLSEEDKTDLNKKRACTLMAANPSLIKRPVIARNGQLWVGFDEQSYREFFLS